LFNCNNQLIIGNKFDLDGRKTNRGCFPEEPNIKEHDKNTNGFLKAEIANGSLLYKRENPPCYIFRPIAKLA
jgi:hypothetical protein